MTTDPASDPGLSRLGERLRSERERLGWPLDELARRSGVSRAMLSRVERGDSSPTATVLGRISGAFGISVSGLLAAVRPEVPRLVRDAAAARWSDPDSGYLRRAVTRPGFPTDVTEVVLPAGGRVAYPAAAFSFLRHTVWVLEGELVLREGSAGTVLGAGDALEFGEPADVEYVNDTAATCRYVVIVAHL